MIRKIPALAIFLNFIFIFICIFVYIYVYRQDKMFLVKDHDHLIKFSIDVCLKSSSIIVVSPAMIKYFLTLSCILIT